MLRLNTRVFSMIQVQFLAVQLDHYELIILELSNASGKTGTL